MKIVLKEKYLSPNRQTAYLVFQLTEKFVFKAGQFVMLSNWQIKRAYSIATTPKEAERGLIWFYVKKVSETWMSKFLVEDIQNWDTLEMIWPFGHMVLDNVKKEFNYLLISIWSGLGPVLSILTEIRWNENINLEAIKVANLYWERYFSSIVPKVIEDMSEIEKWWNWNVKNIIYLSREEKVEQLTDLSLEFRRWHIQDWLEDALKFVWDAAKLKVYICWKPAMVDDIVAKLIDKWVIKDNIKFEKY